jgi:hypothetical protein
MKKIPTIIINIFIISTLIATSITSVVGATYDEKFFSSNDILFYNPTDTGCISSSSPNAITSPDSSGNQETAAKFFTSTNFIGNGNKPMNAVQMAAIMGNIQQESGFNPSAGITGDHRGIIQWTSPGRWDNIAEPKTDINNQLKLIKTELDGLYKDSLSEFWSSSTTDDLNKATYAITRNYEVAIVGNNSSTLWTNNTDATSSLQEWVKRQGYATGFYNQYGNLAGSGYMPGSSCGGLVSGGMALEKATAFMDEYKNLEPKNWASGTTATSYAINGTSCAESSLANCVAFSQYFINRYTDKQYTHTSNGDGVVRDLIALGFKDGGHTPRVYSVFSATFGHTGVVLGIDKDNNKIIIGEASCGQGLNSIHAKEYALSDFSGDIYTYAYTDNALKGVSL